MVSNGSRVPKGERSSSLAFFDPHHKLPERDTTLSRNDRLPNRPPLI